MVSPRVSSSAFSLVEVTVALGIFSFAVMALFGLMPAAVNVHKDAKFTTTLSQIAQQLSSEVLLTDGDKLDQINTGVRLFDAEGREVAGENEAIFRAQIRSQGAQTLPGATQSSESLRRYVIYAAHDPTGSGISQAPAVGSVLVSRAESAQ